MTFLQAHIQFVLLTGLFCLLTSCNTTFPDQYTAQSYIRIGSGKVYLGEFAYVPAIRGDLQVNEIQTNSITPDMYLDKEVAEFVRNATALELKRAGLSVVSDAKIAIKAQILELSFLDSVFSTRWKFRVNYSVYERESENLRLSHIYESDKGGGVFLVNPKLMDDTISETIEDFLSDIIDRKIFQTSQALISKDSNSDGSSAQDDTTRIPEHFVESNTAIGLKSGRRIEVHTEDAGISKKQCTILISIYRKYAMPDGQVSVRIPSSKFDGSMEPWCVENMDDGRGVFFNNHLFE